MQMQRFQVWKIKEQNLYYVVLEENDEYCVYSGGCCKWSCFDDNFEHIQKNKFFAWHL